MAFEGLFAKNIPGLVRTVAPHLPQLLSGLAERFGRDTREIREALAAEMAALRQSHASVRQSLEKQDEAATELREHLRSVERKLDRVAEVQETLTGQLTTLEEQVRVSLRGPRALVLLTMLFSLLAFGVSLASLLLHR